MKSRYLLPALLAVLAAPFASAQAPAPVVETAKSDSPWSLRLRATYLDAVDQTVKVEDKLIPEFDVGYALNDTWSLELVLTVPQEHDVKHATLGPIGNFKHLPPTLLAQYHPACPLFGKNFRPYLGAGVNLTLIFDDDLAAGLKLDNYSVGPAAQAGFDWVVNDTWSINVDVKKIYIGSDVKGAPGLDVNVDPLCLSLGATYRF